MYIEIHPKAKALIFDLDGTLVNSMPLHFEAWCEIANENGFKYTEDVFYSLAGISSAGIVKVWNSRYNLNLNAEKTALLKEEKFIKRIKNLKPINEVIAIVHKYYNILPMAVGTGGERYVAEKELHAVGLDKYFEVIVTADDVRNSKPAPDTFLKCAKMLGIEPKYCHVFEDSELGMEAGRTAGMITTNINRLTDKIPSGLN